MTLVSNSGIALTDRQIEVAEAIVAKLRKELGTKLCSVWLYDLVPPIEGEDWPLFSILCTVDGGDDFHFKVICQLYRWIADVEKSMDAYVEMHSTSDDRFHWEVRADYNNIRRDGVKFYDRDSA